MNTRFARFGESLEPSFQRLVKMQPISAARLPRIMPERGVYLFSDGTTHLYVGRSNNIRRRIGLHCRPGSQHNLRTPECYRNFVPPGQDRAKSFKINYGGFPMSDTEIDDLPPHEIRNAQAIARRALALFGAISLAFENSRDDVVSWLKNEGLWAELSPTELAYISSPNPTEKQRINASWRSEALIVLLWGCARLTNYLLQMNNVILLSSKDCSRSLS